MSASSAPHDAVVARGGDGAELVAERQQLVLVELLVVKDQYSIAIDGRVDLGNCRRRQVGEINARDLADEVGMELVDLDGHGLDPPTVVFRRPRRAHFGTNAATVPPSTGMMAPFT
jgi:hypothetical protein